MQSYLDFEKGLAELQGKAEELRALARQDPNMDVVAEADQLDTRAAELLRDLYAELTPWQKCLVARHAERPHAEDYIKAIFTEYTSLAGDRNFAEDHAIVGGLARLDGRAVAVMGHEKGDDTKTRLERNFGMARPEGYRKIVRLMELAEERGQAEAIARSTDTCLSLGVPLISAVIGEGGSGGAVALATANRVIMLEHAIYSVISPEGCASILWKNAEKMQEAANALRLTAQDLSKLGVIDAVVDEPLGGAHRDKAAAMTALGDALEKGLDELSSLDGTEIRQTRRDKFLEMGKTSLS